MNKRQKKRRGCSESIITRPISIPKQSDKLPYNQNQRHCCVRQTLNQLQPVAATRGEEKKKNKVKTELVWVCCVGAIELPALMGGHPAWPFSKQPRAPRRVLDHRAAGKRSIRRMRAHGEEGEGCLRPPQPVVMLQRGPRDTGGCDVGQEKFNRTSR